MRRENRAMKVVTQLQTAILEEVKPLVDKQISIAEIYIERPAQTSYGDYATPIALTLFKQLSKESATLYKNPRSLAAAVVEKLQEQISSGNLKESVKSVSVAGPGFINFTLSDQFLLKNLETALEPQEDPSKPLKTSQSIIIEYVSPNTNKPLHIGHVRNAALGSAMGKLLQHTGWDVHLGIINNDRGLHITKSMWAYLVFGKKSLLEQTSEVTLGQSMDWHATLNDWIEHKSSWLTPQEMNEARLRKSDHFLGYWYQKGDSYAEDPVIQRIWTEMLQAWEGKTLPMHLEVRALWSHLNNYFYEGFAQTATVLGASFEAENTSYESQLYEAGKAVILEGVKAGKFAQLPDGAIKAELTSFNLPDKVMIRKDGTGLYVLQDIELMRQRIVKDFDKITYVVGVDQRLYFQQLFAIAQLLGYGNQEKFYHFAYGMVRLPEGKMSSRKGRVVYADDLIELAQEKARQIMQLSGYAKELSPDEFEKVAQAVGVGAIKWTMLSQDAQSEITFDLEESVNFSGFAGPYIQYTYARTHSIFKKAENSNLSLHIDSLFDSSIYLNYQLNQDERDVFIAITKYFDVVEKSAAEFAPHHLCTYLHELSQSFNTFYAHQKIVGEAGQQTQLRLAVTLVVQQILAEGLTMLGITPVIKM